jgi:hypothetical protein
MESIDRRKIDPNKCQFLLNILTPLELKQIILKYHIKDVHIFYEICLI